MRPRGTVITLAVADLERAVGFGASMGWRDGLGWATEGVIGTEFEYGAVCCFDLDGGGRLALWPRASLARDSGLPEGAPNATELSTVCGVPD